MANSNFHSVNATINITTTLENLAMAATFDCNVIKQLTHNNQMLVPTNQLLAEQLQVALASSATLAATVQPGQHNGQCSHTPEERVAYTASLDPMSYCWAHGYCVMCGHTSLNCTRKATSHKDAAMRDNNLGGSA